MSVIFEMEVSLPTTNAGVRDLLQAVAENLKQDARRYMKSNKCDESYPAVQDKLRWAKSIDIMATREDKASRKRWKELDAE